jgi:guanylate kinase
VPKDQILDAFDSQKDVILRVDVQGAQTLKNLYPEVVLIFLIPSNQKEWLDRLRSRKTETKESLQLRIQTAKKELESLSEFDYVVVNEDGRLEETVDQIEWIIKAEHLKVQPRRIHI